MIDKKGKLFGIINVIDLVIIIAIVGVAVFLVKNLTSKKVSVENNKPVTLKFYAEEVAQYVGDQVKIGDEVQDEGKNIFLGTVTDVETGDGYMYVPDSNGDLKKAKKEGYYSQEITAHLDSAQIYPHGIMINGNHYNVGHSLTIRAGKAKIYLRISSIEQAEN